MTPFLTTACVLLGLLGVLLLYDFYAAVRWGWDYTVSRVVWTVVKNAPVVAFFLGMVMGHLVWPQQADAEKKKPKATDSLPDFDRPIRRMEGSE